MLFCRRALRAAHAPRSEQQRFMSSKKGGKRRRKAAMTAPRQPKQSKQHEQPQSVTTTATISGRHIRWDRIAMLRAFAGTLGRTVGRGVLWGSAVFGASCTVFVGAAAGYGIALGPQPKGEGGEQEPQGGINRRGDGGGCGCGCGCGSTLPAYEKCASTFDKQLELGETITGVKLLRRWLVGRAVGDVLEVAAGTGRNLAYYDGARCTSLTPTDGAANMLAVMAAKPAPGLDDASGEGGVATAEQGGGSDARKSKRRPGQQEDVTALSFDDSSFDTVVDTFGLCSVDDPGLALREMLRVCRPGGSVLLLEHGASSYGWLTNILDKHAAQHALKWGCWWNRDIAAIVQGAAAATGAEVEELWSYQLGTTYYAVLRPK